MSDPTHKAPEKIWVEFEPRDWPTERIMYGEMEQPYEPYIRADLFTVLEAKLDQQDDLVQAAVAAALREVDKAIQAVADNCTTEDGHLAIVAAVEKVRSSMPQDAQAALDRVVAAERERIALHFEAKLKRGEFADSGADELENCIVRIRKGGE